MIEISKLSGFDSDRYSKNQDQCRGDNYPCVVCGKPVKNPKLYVRYFWGTHAVTDQEAEEIIAKEGNGGDMCLYPIGAACLKKHPELKPYVHK